MYDEASERFVTAVCDGVGSLAQAHRAAAYVAERMPVVYLQRGGWSQALAEVNLNLTAVAEESTRSAPDSTDPSTSGMSTTFIGAAVSIGSQLTLCRSRGPTTVRRGSLMTTNGHS